MRYKRAQEPVVLPGFSFKVRGNPEPQETGDGPTRLRRRQRGGLAKLLDKKLAGKGRRRIFIGPTGCGKSKLAKAIALADLRQGLKVLVSVPQHVIGAGFEFEEIVMPDGKIEVWDPHVLSDEADSEALKNFLLEPPTPDRAGRIFICTHATLVRVLAKLNGKKDAWAGTSLVIDETHHSMYEDRDDEEDLEENANGLGEVVGHYLAHDSGPITLMTATWLRSDGKIVGNQKSRFTIDTYHMDEYLKDTFKELNIRFKFVLGDRVESLAKIVAADPKRKTIVWFPTISGWMPTPEAKWKLLGQCKSALKKLGVSICDLVTDDEEYARQKKATKRQDVTDALLDTIEEQKYAIKHGKRPPNNTPDVLFALGLCQEGFDMPELSRAILLAPRGQIRQTIQMLGRLLRYWPGKTDVEFNIILPVEPEAVKMEAVLKIIFASMFVDWQFRRISMLPKGKGRAAAQAAGDCLADPEVSEKATKSFVANAINNDGKLSTAELVDEMFVDVPELAALKPDEQVEGKKLVTKFFRQLHDADDVPLDVELERATEKNPIGGLIEYWVSKCSAGRGTKTLRELREALGRERPRTLDEMVQELIDYHKAQGGTTFRTIQDEKLAKAKVRKHIKQMVGHER